MFNKRIMIGALASVAAFSSFAEEGGVSYTYVGIAYQTGDIVDEDFSGFGVGGSAAITDSVFVLAQYSSLTSDDEFDAVFGLGADEIDVTQFNFGIGFHTPITSDTDFFAAISYADVEAEYRGRTADGNGYLVNAGVRTKPTDVLEFGASINYADIENETETGYSLSARFFTAPKVSIGLGYGSTDDVDIVSFDLRFDI